MVTSNKQPEKKVVKMGEHNNSAVVPQRTLLGEVNEHITCPLCRGYYIDATTIVECLHSFCRSCIIKHLKAKSYCPVCEMMINSAKPNIKLDKALQDIVYKLVPGLFQKEMERRQTFYASRPGPAASATPEQRGEDTERIIFSPEDVISFSLEYSDATDTDSISSKSSDSNEPPSTPATNRRYLQCPAVVNISHLKKFLSMKFDIDSTQFAIDILYKRVPLPDYYTLMDIAYIYNWKRNEPMRFFYQIIDYIAIRNRIFDVNRKSTLNENKASPALTEDTNTSSPAPTINDQASEASSGTNSPMPEENSTKQSNKKDDKLSDQSNLDKSPSILKKNDDEVEKSQFLNSFELTAKSNCLLKSSPGKSGSEPSSNESPSKTPPKSPLKVEEKPETLKRKFSIPQNAPEMKKLRIEIEKTKLANTLNNSAGSSTSGNNNSPSSQQNKSNDTKPKVKEPIVAKKTEPSNNATTTLNTSVSNKDSKPPKLSNSPLPTPGSPGLKRPVMSQQGVATPKRKPEISTSMQPPASGHKTVSPIKIPVPKMEPKQVAQKAPESTSKPPAKKMPDLKPGVPPTQSLQNKVPPVTKVLLANNSDPTIDRSKILSQVKTSLSAQNSSSPSGDPLKTLFDSCKINIPSSLSITLTDQKLDPRAAGEQVANDQKKNVVNKNLAAASNTLSHKVPSPPVHNYIEILKLPDNDANKKSTKGEGSNESKNTQPKNEAYSAQPKPPNKSTETSAKGPVPNLKPIADTKLGKQQQTANYATSPITFQQTFEQQIQTLQTDKKPKVPKVKGQVPKLVPATPKSLSAANKPNPLINKPSTPTDSKTGAALDLSSPHNVQPPSGNQTFDKAFETMQTIANLAKKQNLPAKGLSPSMSQNTSFPAMSSRPLNPGISPLRIPGTNTMNQIKHEKIVSSGSQLSNRQEPMNKPNPAKSSNSSSPTTPSPSYQMPPHPSLASTQPSPRQNRSPSSSPKLVIAEEKQGGSASSEQNLNQSNQITSTQLSNTNAPKPETPAMPGPSKLSLKSLKSMTSSGKLPSRQPITPNIRQSTPSLTNSPDYLQPQYLAQHALMRRQMEMNAAWLKAQRQYDFDIFKNMSNLAHQGQNDFNKDKQ